MNKGYCELHQSQLYSGEAELMYGIWVPSRSPEYIEALTTFFPNSKLKLPGVDDTVRIFQKHVTYNIVKSAEQQNQLGTKERFQIESDLV